MTPEQAHELKLAKLLAAYESCPDPEKRGLMWVAYQVAHAKRAPEVVEQMEREQGLA